MMRTTHEDFYRYQQRRLGILLAWGTASALVGPLGFLSRDPLWRQFGLQTCTWGAIDAALAFFGIRGARDKAVRRAHGKLTALDEQRDARRFRTVLLVNAGLDVLYILGGATLACRQQDRRDRRGMGLGIIPQGVFLLLYDSLLAWEVGNHPVADNDVV